jgi:hypothetical protein
MLKGITEQDAAKLAESVKKSKGSLIVLVHPYFQNVDDEGYFRTIGGIIGKRKNLVILQEQEKVPQLRAHLKRLQRPCIIIPTPTQYSAPLLADNCADHGHGELYGFAKSVGAKAVFLGGMNLFDRDVDADNLHVEQYERNWLQARDRKKNPEAVRAPSKTASTKQCVGNAYNELVRHAMLDKKKGNAPLAVRLMPGAAYGPMPYYSLERRHLHK